MDERKPLIRIFVSHRIDLPSPRPDNPLYFPMRCGAACDPENLTGLPGDDTGDNISRKRMEYSELTVQYWAWKNARADYYGLCHYRRYLSFGRRKHPVDPYGMVHVRFLLPEEERRFGLTDRKRMETLIPQYDAVTSFSADVRRLPLPGGRRAASVGEWWSAHTDYLPPGAAELALDCIRSLAPDYLEDARAYLAGDRFRGNNCYILRRELFQALCAFEFPLLEELEGRVAREHPDYAARRCPGYFGEMLYGIFMHRLLRDGRYRVLQLQLVYFADASLPAGKGDLRRRRLLQRLDRLLRPLMAALLPIGSPRREALKRKGESLRNGLRRK